MSTLVERGILGAVGLLLAAWLSLRVLLESRPRPSHRDYVLLSGLMLGGIAFLIQSNTNNLLNNERLGLLFLVLVVVAAQFARLRRTSLDGVDEVGAAEALPQWPRQAATGGEASL